ncbi:helix-turn-helix transcriptional regulator [Pseudactinotalea sp. Z1739]|uniref:helix-turn-helix transcriptional regulator n=1 Tax=Pseudactinotalea sp. Z1739 TaxID=3413028 RepID=UPI003C7AE0B2
MDLVRYEPARRLSLPQVAAEACLSPEYFSRMFTEQVGVSFRQFAVTARLERGFELLSETRMSVTQVARALGYEDPFLFSRQFRKLYGCPPSQVRAVSP